MILCVNSNILVNEFYCYAKHAGIYIENNTPKHGDSNFITDFLSGYLTQSGSTYKLNYIVLNMQVVQADEAVANAAAQEAQAIKVLQYRLFHNNSFQLDFGKPLINSLRSIHRVTEFS